MNYVTRQQHLFMSSCISSTIYHSWNRCKRYNHFHYNKVLVYYRNRNASSSSSIAIRCRTDTSRYIRNTSNVHPYDRNRIKRHMEVIPRRRLYSTIEIINHNYNNPEDHNDNTFHSITNNIDNGVSTGCTPPTATTRRSHIKYVFSPSRRTMSTSHEYHEVEFKEPTSLSNNNNDTTTTTNGTTTGKAASNENSLTSYHDDNTTVNDIIVDLKDDTVNYEAQYSRKSPIEHVLLRPGMYVGPNERLPPSSYYVIEQSIPSIISLDTIPQPQEYIQHISQPISEMEKERDGTTTTMNQQTIMGNTEIISKLRMVQREYGIVPALVKIFDEILVNASDNRLRHPKTCNQLHVIIHPGSENITTTMNHNDISTPTNETTTTTTKSINRRPYHEAHEPYIRVYNNGKGIPIHMHATEHMYIPELIFGHLLTGSNFDDTEKRITGGRHGYGAKLTNIFSKSFHIETVDVKKGLKYQQSWYNNMSVVHEPIITKLSKDEKKLLNDYTCIEFIPDIHRLTNGGQSTTDHHMNHMIPKEDYDIMCRRVIDVAGCGAGKLHVTLNGMNVSMPSFTDYCLLYRSDNDRPLCFLQLNPRWMIAVGLSNSGSFESISFVNGMVTTRGGTHVNVILNQIIKYVQETIKKNHPDIAENITQSMIKRNIFLCMDTQIENATFDSQMKEYLTSSPDTFGTSFNLSKSFLKQLLQSEDEDGPGIIEQIVRQGQGQQHATLLKNIGGKKTRRQLLSIPKLEDAHRAGRMNSVDDIGCTLILTEGDSAKSLAVAGLEVLGRDTFGVFPLRGKLLNVRDVNPTKLAMNAEIKALLSIIGLNFDEQYDTIVDRCNLRYRRVLIMTDQDTDGSHIKGLVINFFRYFWPKLLQPPVDETPGRLANDTPFLASFVTPLLKASKKGKKKNETLAFYSMGEYEAWKRELDANSLKGWTIKYYKGLGTSTPAEAKEYFTAFVNNLRPFRWRSDSDGEVIDMVFDKKRAAERKDWILDTYDPDSSIAVDAADGNAISYEDFINKEMIHFSHGDNIRSIPNALDGLKPSQRKVLYACFKRNLKSEIKVAQLSGYCAEHTAYHHGEMSLQSTIVGMAQDFVGSNNINLLVPSGQFGTRLIGGSDAASARYIFTHLSPITRILFPEEDEVLLTYCDDDGQPIEPKFFCPIIPMLLVNGCQGIGTGWSSTIPSFSPIDVLQYIRAKLNNDSQLPKIHPYTRGFTGEIIERPTGDGYVSIGRASAINRTSILIDELPVGCWTSTYKQFLAGLQEKGSISNFFENHTTTKVSFTITVKTSQMMKFERTGFTTAFKLQSTLLTSNMHAFDENGVIRKYNTPEEIADHFFRIRMGLYEDRKSVMESEMQYQSLLASNKAKFIEKVTSNEIDLLSGTKSKVETLQKLEELGFLTNTGLYEVRNDNEPFRRRKLLVKPNVANETIEEDVDDDDEGLKEYDYLLNMPLSSLTKEKVSALKKEAVLKDSEFHKMQATTASDLWRHDLDKLEVQLQKLIKS